MPESGSVASGDYYIVPPCHEPVVDIYQDEHILVVEKPAFLLSVPGRGPENHDSVFSRLLARDERVLLLHRLDLDTSGLMVFARSRLAQKAIARGFQKRTIEKRYEAVVAGLVNAESGTITLPIARDWENRPRNKIDATGKTALTEWTLINRDVDNHCSRLALKPVTGRSHQLRLHLMAIGHPILGCDLYAPAEVEARSDRLLLHACGLGFYHPATNDWVSFYSKVPF